MKIALITGAGRGLGRGIALRLAGEGYDIWANYRSDSVSAESLKSKIESMGRKCELLKFDVGDEAAVKESLGKKLETAIPEVLVNNAGFSKDGLLMWMPEEDWHSVLNVSLSGFYNITKSVLFGMMEKRRGKIINIVSTAGENGLPGQVNYSAAKAGIIGATKSLAKEVARRGILVNAVSPGFINTDMTADLPRAELEKNIPLERFGEVKEVAGVVSFLCSDDASYITGQVISVNGGMYM